MEIKISLKQLSDLFVQSAANEELSTPVRQFAAQLTILTAHVNRVEAKANAIGRALKAMEGKLDGEIAELAQFVMTSRPASETPGASITRGDIPNGEAEPQDSEEDAAKAMAEQVLRETEAEVAALAAAPPTAGARKSNGGPTPGVAT